MAPFLFFHFVFENGGKSKSNGLLVRFFVFYLLPDEFRIELLYGHECGFGDELVDGLGFEHFY
jgi:hypothetical protein